MKTQNPLHKFTVACVLGAALSWAGVVNAATEAEKQQAIDDGLAYLASTQSNTGYWSYNNGGTTAATGAAMLAFIEEGYSANDGSAYGAVVAKGMNYLFSQAQRVAISPQLAGNPDHPTVGEAGFGTKFNLGGAAGRDTYVTGLVLPTLAAHERRNPGGTVQTGIYAGQTYSSVIQDTVDYFAYGQVDSGGGRGGWRYWANYSSSDNSTAQWPAVGMLFAEGAGASVPTFVKDELRIWINTIQNPTSGGSGYSNSGELVNMSKTGGLLVEMAFAGFDSVVTSADETAALNYINNQWATNANSTWNGNFGHPYAMWSVYKGLETTIGLNDTTTITPRLQAGAAIDSGDTWNWYEDYTESLVNSQNTNGSWSGYSNWYGPMATAWNINILNATVIPQGVPEGGSTLAFLGLSLLGLIGAKRRSRR